MKKTRKFKDYLIEKLKDPTEAKIYINVALEDYQRDNDAETFLLAVRDVAEAMGGISNLAKNTNLNRQNLYRALSSKGNPKLITLGNILNGLGFHLSVEPNQKAASMISE